MSAPTPRDPAPRQPIGKVRITHAGGYDPNAKSANPCKGTPETDEATSPSPLVTAADFASLTSTTPPMPTADTFPQETPTQFDYLLNAFEAASQMDNPAEHGYAEKRRRLFAYVRKLEASANDR